MKSITIIYLSTHDHLLSLTNVILNYLEAMSGRSSDFRAKILINMLFSLSKNVRHSLEVLRAGALRRSFQSSLDKIHKNTDLSNDVSMDFRRISTAISFKKLFVKIPK
jgi:hypothetical protein